KKTTAKSPDIFRVLEIPQKNRGIPTYRSANKYVPYTKYRGRTYIYVENDSGDDTYIGDISSTDVTSSDSEVDEIDINEIYGYGGGKHKTLIDIILRPSTSPHGTTYSGTTYSGTNIHSNTIYSVTHSTSGNHSASGNMDIVDTTTHSDTIYSDIPSDIVDTTPPSGTTHNSGNTNSDTTPSGTTQNSGNTPNSGIIPRIPSDIPINKLTDNEWNKIKEDFISNMLQTEQNDVVEIVEILLLTHNLIF
ncbi:putative EMP1-like protein, partial [Plasmodium gaboni]